MQLTQPQKIWTSAPERTGQTGIVRTLLLIAGMALILSCIFDPADKILGMKVPLFVLFGTLAITSAFQFRDMGISARALTVVTTIGLVVPLYGLVRVLIADGAPSDQTLLLLKAHLFIFMSLFLLGARLRIEGLLAFALCLLSIAIIIVSLMVEWQLVDLTEIDQISYETGAFGAGERSYGSFDFQATYFHSSPLLMFGIAYFTSKAITERGTKRMASASCMLLVMVAMILGGTRASMIMSLAIPVLVLATSGQWQRYKLFAAPLIIAAIVFGFRELLIAMFDAGEISNAIKLGYLQDYAEIFSDPITFLFGQGLGARQSFASFGDALTITELTYLELMRWYGAPVELLLLACLASPLLGFFKPGLRESRYIFVGYLCYLTASSFNPHLLTSSGMLVASIAMFHYFSSSVVQRARHGI
jgi:hypothetical protein